VQLSIPSGGDANVGAALRRAAASLAIVAVAFAIAAYVAGTRPFEGRIGEPSSHERAVRALPFDAPLPYDIDLTWAGRGEDLPYRLVYASNLAPDALGAQVADHLDGSPKWQLTQHTDLRGEFDTTFSRVGSDGLMTHFAVATLHERSGGGSVFTFDFIPMTELGKDD